MFSHLFILLATSRERWRVLLCPPSTGGTEEVAYGNARKAIKWQPVEKDGGFYVRVNPVEMRLRKHVQPNWMELVKTYVTHVSGVYRDDSNPNRWGKPNRTGNIKNAATQLDEVHEKRLNPKWRKPKMRGNPS